MSYIIIIFEKIPCYIWMKGIRNLSETPYRMRRCSRSIRHVHFNAVLYVCCDALQHTLVNVAPMCEWENSIQRLRGTYIYDTNTCTPTAHSIYTYTSLWQRSYLFIWNNVFNSRVAAFYFFSISFVVCRIRFTFQVFVSFCIVFLCIQTAFVRSFVHHSLNDEDALRCKSSIDRSFTLLSLVWAYACARAHMQLLHTC